MNRVLQRHFSSKVAVLFAFSGFLITPAQAVLGPIAGTAAYAAVATAKNFALGKALGYGIQSVSKKVYDWQKPLGSLEEISRERFVVITIPQGKQMITLSGLSLHVPQELRDKEVRVDLAKLDLAKKIINFCSDAQKSFPAQDQAKKFLAKCESDILAKVIELASKHQHEEARIKPYEHANKISPQAQALYFTSIINIIEACRTMLEQLQKDLPADGKKTIIQNRDVKIMRAMCQVITTKAHVPKNIATGISEFTTPSFCTQDHLKKVEQFRKEDSEAQGMGTLSAIGAACLAIYAITNYGQPLCVKILQATSPGTALLNMYSGWTNIAQKAVNSGVTYVGSQLSLPRSIAENGSTVFGLANHSINFLTACTGIGASWLAIDQQNKANRLFLNPTSTIMTRIKGLGLGMLYSVGSLASSSWLTTLVNPHVRSASWPLSVHALVSLFYRPLPI